MGGTVAGSELRLLGPGRATAREHVRRAGIIAVVVIEKSPDHGGIPVHCNRDTEQIAGCAVAGGELLLLGPHARVAGEHVNRTGITAIVVVRRNPDHGSIPVHGN